MFTVRKRIEISAAHLLHLPYESPCSKLHGHNWIIEVEVSSPILNSVGMVMDFTHIKKVVMALDHTILNDIMPVEPTAEKIAGWIADKISKDILPESSAWVSKVTVQESEGNEVCYTP